MPNYIVRDNQIHFRQSFSRDILCKLFLIIWELGLNINDSDNKCYPHNITMSESDFLSVLELAQN